MELDFAGVDKVLREFVTPGLAAELAQTSEIGRLLWRESFLHDPEDMNPEFWLWDALRDVPCETDQSPWGRK